MIYKNAGTGCQEESLDVYGQPEELHYDRHGIKRWVWVKYEAVEDDDDVGNVAHKSADIAKLHESIHLANCATQILVTSTK